MICIFGDASVTDVGAERRDYSVVDLLWDLLSLYGIHGNWILARQTKDQ